VVAVVAVEMACVTGAVAFDAVVTMLGLGAVGTVVVVIEVRVLVLSVALRADALGEKAALASAARMLTATARRISPTRSLSTFVCTNTPISTQTARPQTVVYPGPERRNLLIAREICRGGSSWCVRRVFRSGGLRQAPQPLRAAAGTGESKVQAASHGRRHVVAV
jgi:hypothetical protein